MKLDEKEKDWWAKVEEEKWNDEFECLMCHTKFKGHQKHPWKGYPIICASEDCMVRYLLLEDKK